MKHKRILIVGAGITGSTLAALLEQRGIVPTIVDKSREDDPNGFGITIMPAGLQVLQVLGIRSALEKAGNVLRGCTLYDEHGNTLNSFDLSPAGIHSITLDRDDLLATVRQKLAKTTIRWQTSIKSLRQRQNEVAVTFTDGSTGVYDLVIGADGLNSLTRTKLFPSVKPAKVGAGIWMLALPEDFDLDDRSSGQLVFGNYRFMAVFPYRNTAAVAFTKPLNATTDPESVDLIQAFGDMSPLAARILSVVDRKQIHAAHLRQLKLPDWHKGRVVLAGDAAHAMLPATGLGASNGIQDAAVLARMITEMPVDLFDLLPAQYQNIRKPAVNAKQREAYLLGHVMLLNKYPAVLRNTVFKLIPRSVLGKAVVRN